jgi:hypothetical protein
MPARIDYLCIGKDQVDQADMLKIIGLFVDEKRRCASLNSTSVYILLAKLVELIGT